MLTRRQFAGGSVALVSSGLIAERSVSGEPASFGTPLPIPQLIDAAKQGNAVKLKVMSGRHAFIKGKPARTYGYSAPILGPVVRLRRGDEVEMTVENALDFVTTVHWHGLLMEIAPRVSRVAVFVQPETTTSAAMWRAVEGSGPSLSIEVNSAAVHDASEIEHAITTFADQANGGLIVLPGPVGTGHRDLIIALAARHRLPAIYPFRYFAAAGGLISYGPDSFDLFRRTALYVDRILKGERPGDSPVQNPTKFEFVINMKTANALGLTVPQSLLVAADEVIE
jgi:hypothetical protein